MDNINYTLNELNKKRQYRKIPQIQRKNSGKIIIDGIEYVNLASNDYLGISTNRDLQKEFLEKCNSNLPLFSSASARLLTGSSPEFSQLEETLAKLFNKEACLIFNTGYQCNLGVISALIGREDVVFSDKLNHASIIDGMKLSEGSFFRYKHNDYEHLESILKNLHWMSARMDFILVPPQNSSIVP